MTKVVSNKKQLCRLVELMEKNPDIAKGLCPKQIATNKWKVLTKELNRLGPPEREWFKWLRVWSDIKVKVKKKQLQNRFLKNKVEEGPQRFQHLSASEEAVVKLLELDMFNDSSKKEPDCEDDIEIVIEDNLQNNISQNNEKMEDNKTIDDVEETIQKKKSKIGNQALVLLEQQTNEQKQFYDQINTVLGDIKKSAKITELYTKKIFKLKEYKCKELLKIKRKKLQIYKRLVEKKIGKEI